MDSMPIIAILLAAAMLALIFRALRRQRILVVPYSAYSALEKQRDGLARKLQQKNGVIRGLAAIALAVVLLAFVRPWSTDATSTGSVPPSPASKPPAPPSPSPSLNNPLWKYVAGDCADDGMPTPGVSIGPIVVSRISCRFGDLTLYAHRYAPYNRAGAEPTQSEKPAPATGGCPSGFRIVAVHIPWTRQGRQGHLIEYLHFRTVERTCVVDSKIWLVDDHEPDIALILFGRLAGSPDRPDFQRLRKVLGCLGYETPDQPVRPQASAGMCSTPIRLRNTQ